MGDVDYKNWYRTNGERVASRVSTGMLHTHATSAAQSDVREYFALEFAIDRTKGDDEDPVKQRFMLKLSEAQVQELHALIEQTWFDGTSCPYLSRAYPDWKAPNPAIGYRHESEKCPWCLEQVGERQEKWARYHEFARKKEERLR